MMPVKKSAKNDVSDGAFARLQHNSRYSLEFDVGLDETSPTYELRATSYTVLDFNNSIYELPRQARHRVSGLVQLH